MNPATTQPDLEAQASPAPVRFPSGFLLMAALLALALYFWLAISRPEVLPIKYVRIKNDLIHLSPGQLKENATKLVRGGFFDVNVEAIRRGLLREAWINEVTVRRVWPDTLTVYIAEHEPVARWRDKHLLSRDGKVFTPTADSFPAGLPLLHGPPGSHGLALEKRELLQAKLAPWNLSLASLTLTERRSWEFKLASGPRIVLGKREVDEKLERFFRFVLAPQALNLSQVESIDMRYTNGFAIKWMATPAITTAG